MALTRAALATCRLLRVAPPARTRHAVHALPSAGPAAPPCRAASAVRRSSTGAPRGAHVPSFYAARVRGYRPRHIAAWATAVGIAGAIAYCAGQDEVRAPPCRARRGPACVRAQVPFTGRSRLMLISTDIERGWGEMVFRAVVKDASERDEIVAEDDPRVALVHKVRGRGQRRTSGQRATALSAGRPPPRRHRRRALRLGVRGDGEQHSQRLVLPRCARAGGVWRAVCATRSALGRWQGGRAHRPARQHPQAPPRRRERRRGAAGGGAEPRDRARAGAPHRRTALQVRVGAAARARGRARPDAPRAGIWSSDRCSCR